MKKRKSQRSAEAGFRKGGPVPVPFATGGILSGEGKPTLLGEKGPPGCVIPLNARGMKILSAALRLAAEKGPR